MEDKAKIVIENYNGIVPFYEAFYLESILYAAGIALDAFQRFDEGLQTEKDAEAVVASLQEALTHSAALARFFWPIRDRGTTFPRGEKLRTAFSLNDISALSNKDLRHALEHFDEYLDRFLLEDHVGTFYPASIIGTASLNDEPVINIFRLVDPGEEVFILLGKKYVYGSIHDEVKSIYDKATKMYEDGGRLRV